MRAEHTPQSGRRWLGLWVIIVAVGLVSTGCSARSESSGPTSTSSPGNPETIVAPTSSVATATPVPSPKGASPTPRRADSGTRMTARMDTDDGSFDITEVVRLTDPISSLTLRPPDLRGLGGVFAGAKPVARDLEVTAGGRSVKVRTTEVRKLTSLALPEPARRVELHYRLTGVTHRSEPSAAGRALAALGPVVAGVPDDLPVAVAVPGPTVRNLQCPTAAEQSCAVGPPGHLRIARPLPWNAAVVIVQIDMS